MDLPPPLPRADVAVELKPSLLAGPLLAYLRAENPGPFARFNRANTVRRFDAAGREVLLAISAAWAWLEREGLVVPAIDVPDYGVQMLSSTALGIDTREQFERYRQASLLPRGLLHPIVAEKAWSLFATGDYDTAVFAAFKAVEVEVATRSGCDGTGVPLMRAAFHQATGPLADRNLNEGERVGVAALFAGAFATIRNPAGHRNVEYTSPMEPAEQLMIASHLMRLIEAPRR